MLSFWETESFLNYDTIIIGSGIVGLSAAISLKEAAPQKSVLVLERSLLPTGASTRNAGFACFGSLTEVLFDLNLNGPEKTRAVIDKRLRGLARLRERLPDAAMDYQHVGGYELIFEKDLPALLEIETANYLLRDLFPDGVYANRPELVQQFGFDRQQVKSVVYNPHEGHLHSGKLMRTLLELAQHRGVEIRTGADVTDIDDSGNGVEITVNDPVRGELTFRSGKAAVCTNAFSARLCPDVLIKPGRGQVLLTKPIPTLNWKGACHFDEGFYYFRNVGKRVLFGGGRNLDFAAETTTELTLNERIQAELERLLRELILPGQEFEVEQRWSGIMGFSEDKQPVIRKLSPQLVLGFACNGMGVSLASAVGDDIAALLLQ